VKAGVSGTVAKLSVQPTDEVKSGQVIAVITRDKADLEDRIRLKQEQLSRAQAQAQSDMGADQLTIVRNESMRQAKKGELQSLQQQRKTQEELVNKGLKPANVLFDFDRRINGVQAEINGIDKENAMLRSRGGPRSNEVANLQGELQGLENMLQRSDTEVTAPEDGRIVEVLKSTSDKVREGEALLRMELMRTDSSQKTVCDGNIHAVMYVSGNLAGKVKHGEPARVSPTDVKKEEYGYIVGTVEWVSSFAASSDDMREKLKNDSLVRDYQAQGPVFEARVCLALDPKNTVNGLKWSSSQGPNKKIESGTLITASLVVDQRKPYTYVVPAVKKAVGM
jgi:HlyD family secretion protein